MEIIIQWLRNVCCAVGIHNKVKIITKLQGSIYNRIKLVCTNCKRSETWIQVNE